MKKNLYLLLIAFIASSMISAQNSEADPEFKPSGKAFGKVFFNYNYNFTKGESQRNTFALQRAYFGYKYNFSSNISFKLTLDAVRAVKDTDGNLLSPYTANLKHAQLDWKVASPVKLSIGLIGLKQFDTQEKFWGYRYLYKSFQDEFALGSSADLGINAEIKILESLKANVFVLNGEGYSRIQDGNGRIKAGGNLLFTPVKGLTLKGYYDIYGGKFKVNDTLSTDTTSIHTIAFFAGYKAKKFRIGAEFDYQMNGKKFYQQAADHDILGFAVYGTYIINQKFEVFGQWLQFKSNKVGSSDETWKYDTDGNIIIIGAQYIPVKGVKIAANYRGLLYDDPENETGSFFFLNFEFAF
jgi:hypothetical protein